MIKLAGILDAKEDGDKLSAIEVHDMVCHVADAVLAGGIRRAALISKLSTSVTLSFDKRLYRAQGSLCFEKAPKHNTSGLFIL